MAKGSAMGLWRGKKGSTVFYKLTNSNNSQKQGIRERVYEVANPQSNGQATQRAKLLPAQRVAGALREIIERGWQGVDYGAKSRSEFLKYALKMSSGYPFVTKDDDRIVPGAYQITKGTIGTVVCEFDEVTAGDLVTSIYIGGADAPTTMGELAQIIIDRNINIKEGDQLTFICVLSDQTTAGSQLEFASYSWSYYSFYVDTTDTTQIDAQSGSINAGEFNISVLPTDGDFVFFNTERANARVVAGAVVISRLGDGGQYMRSTAKLVYDEEILAPWFSAAQRNRARESYQTANASVANTNWPVDGDAEQIEGTYQSTLTLSGLTGELATANGQEILVRKRESDDTLTAVYYKIGTISESPCVVKSDGSFISVGSSVENRHELRVSECPQVADLPQILYQ